MIVGNSATDTNCHEAVFEMLKHFSNKDVEIYCPLSYGDKTYAEKVAAEGKKLFGGSFVPVMEYMDREKYFNFLSCMDIKKYVEKFPDKIKLYIMPREKEQKYDSVKRASANRLNILKHSTGDIFCVLDGDDYYIDYNFINESIDIFNKNRDVSIAVFGYETIENGISAKKYTLKSTKSEHIFDEKEYLKDYYIHAGACVFRKSFGIKRIDYLKK